MRNASFGTGRTGAFVLLVCVFFLSGLCGLVYEVVWSRLLVLVFGSTTYAISTVVGVYMLGLALGGYLAGRLLQRIDSLPRAYALLEIGVGLYALLFLSVLAGVDALHARLFPYLYETPALLNAARVSLCLAALLPPTTMMGATLPLLSHYLARGQGSIGRDVGLLYCINTWGAASGCFLSAFVAIPALGLDASIHGAGLANILIGVAVWFFPPARSPRQEAGSVAAGTRQGVAPTGQGAEPRADWVLWAFALSGLLALVFEVAWSRALVLVFGSSVYSFSTMLTCFLCGLALGSMLCSRIIDRVERPAALFGALCALMGLSVLLTTPLIGRLPEFFVRLYSPEQTGWSGLMLMEFGMCFAVMFPATLTSGALFPVAARIFALSRAQSVGRTVGQVYAYNTVGGILGSLCAGFWLIPRFGAEKSLLYGGAACMLLGAATLVRTARDSGRGVRRVHATAASLSVLAVALAWTLPSWDAGVLNLGVYRNTQRFVEGRKQLQDKSGLKAFSENNRLLFYRESHDATVAVTQDQDGSRVLVINGKADGGVGSGLDAYTQTLLGMLPMFYVRAPRDALVIGLATGMTFGGALNFPLKNVECIEISEAVVEASHYFDEHNGRPLERSNGKLRILDGRTWLLAMPNTYDAIICEPSNPWQTGNANLFTLEFYRNAAKRLTPNGVFCQWLPLYDLTEEQYRMLLATFKEVFPYVNLWMWMSDSILIGAKHPLSMDIEELDRALNIPAVKASLAPLGIHTRLDLISFFYLDAANTSAFASGARLLNTDRFPRIEFASSKNVHRTVEQGDILTRIGKLTARSTPPLPWPEDDKALREAILQTRIRIYENIGIPAAMVRELFSQ
jgi:spermidine synthase